ncbi:MAG: M42 family peptidase [Phycisphaerales bacterium]|nr:M42 family peptidase [Phycisphaerales bacterium]
MKIDLLRRLCETAGVAGREERVRQLIESETTDLFDERRTDAMGSLICTRQPTSSQKLAGAAKRGGTTRAGAKSTRPLRVMIAAHMDEIGFYVRHVDEFGFLWLNAAGGFDPRNLFSRRVLVVAKGGDFVGVMNPSGKPIHISTEAERSKIPGVEEFFVDLGMNPKEVAAKVQVGDYVVMQEPFLEQPHKLVSKAMDNRMACFVAIEAVRAVARQRAGHACELVVAFTTQEEVGLRGASVAANEAGADIGIGLDVNLACDTPGIPENQRITKHGSGVAIMVQDSSMISDHKLVEEFCALARKHRIDHQRAILARGGQDAGAIQRSGRGARCIALGAGTRYIHTVTESIDRNDLQSTIELLAAYLVSAGRQLRG